jgi:hypothetical protein
MQLIHKVDTSRKGIEPNCQVALQMPTAANMAVDSKIVVNVRALSGLIHAVFVGTAGNTA